MVPSLALAWCKPNLSGRLASAASRPFEGRKRRYELGLTNNQTTNEKAGLDSIIRERMVVAVLIINIAAVTTPILKRREGRMRLVHHITPSFSWPMERDQCSADATTSPMRFYY